MRESIFVDGTEYITQKDFSIRMKISVATVYRYVQKQVLRLEREGEAKGLLPFEESKKAVQKEQARVIRNTRKKYRPTLELVLPTAKAEELPTLEGVEEQEESLLHKDLTEVELHNVKWQDYTDCLQYSQDLKPIINPVTQKPLMDYERLKTRLTAEKYRLDCLQKREPYLEAEQNNLLCDLIEKVFLEQSFTDLFVKQIQNFIEKKYNVKLTFADKKSFKKIINAEETYFKNICENCLEQQRGVK